MLNKEDKIKIINDLIRTIEYSRFLMQQEIDAEKYVGNYSEEWIVEEENKLSNLDKKIEYLNSALDEIYNN